MQEKWKPFVASSRTLFFEALREMRLVTFSVTLQTQRKYIGMRREQVARAYALQCEFLCPGLKLRGKFVCCLFNGNAYWKVSRALNDYLLVSGALLCCVCHLMLEVTTGSQFRQARLNHVHVIVKDIAMLCKIMRGCCATHV